MISALSALQWPRILGMAGAARARPAIARTVEIDRRDASGARLISASISRLMRSSKSRWPLVGPPGPQVSKRSPTNFWTNGQDGEGSGSSIGARPSYAEQSVQLTGAPVCGLQLKTVGEAISDLERAVNLSRTDALGLPHSVNSEPKVANIGGTSSTTIDGFGA
jgi:hypothetical protein